MTVTFFSNFINEHQIPFCEAMFKRLKGGYRFVATEPISQERLNMGFEDQSDRFSYVVKSFCGKDSYEEALRLGRESDVVIIGSAPDEFIKDRLKENKLTFRYCERYFKEGKWRMLDPRVFVSHLKNDIRYRNKNLHMLCASAYTAPDCRFILSYPNKTYKWGYFPPVKRYENVDEIIKNKKPNSILWTARLIPLKRPEAAISVAERLKKDGYGFELNIIGKGEMEEKIKSLIDKKGLSENVHLLGVMPPEKVRERMEESEIFLFTSDRNEGWGAVLNESMNSACAVAANREIGSVPFLIKQGENGLIYDRKEKDSLYENVKRLLDDEKLRKKVQHGAYRTMTELWNADTAAERLIGLIDSIKNGKEPNEKSGPCSRS